jgi:glycosyltransferase involved in cell wall biosynthesis
MPNPLVSVIIPTYNRLDHLQAAIRAVLNQTYQRLELIVVDNNCTDGTDTYVRSLARVDKRVRYLREDTQGLNPARNRGLVEARGEWVAYLDDDELPPTYWLANLMDCCRETGADGAGGGYLGLWEDVPPKWLSRSECLEETVGVCSRGEERKPVQWLLGGNCFYRREALEEVRGFGSYAGYRGRGSLADGADVAVGHRLVAAGYKLWHEPTAHVFHKMPLERQSMLYIGRRAFWSAYADGIHGDAMNVGRKVGRATKRGPEAMLLGLVIVPGQLYGRTARVLTRLVPKGEEQTEAYSAESSPKFSVHSAW